MSPYLLFGFLLAGILHSFVPRNIYKRFLSANNMRSILWAALFGIPLPLCSCGVIPTAMGLRRQGASRGATVSFLIATPQTGVDSIIATYSLMGLPMAIIRPLAALVTALLGGRITMAVENDKCKEPISLSPEDSPSEQRRSLRQKITDALRYAFVEMMEDIGKWLTIGLLVAGIITVAVPDEWFTAFQNNSPLSILFVLLFSIPMYLCATGSIPIAIALMLKGLTPGAAFVLLMAGPASNAASILVIRKVLGHKTLMSYLFSIIMCAVFFGLGMDYLLPREWFTERLIAMQHSCTSGSQWLNQLCTWILITLLINARFFTRKNHHHKNAAQMPHATGYIVQGMHCNHCVNNVQEVLSSVQGIVRTDVDLSTGKVIIEGKYSEEDVIQAVKSLGFEISKDDEL